MLAISNQPLTSLKFICKYVNTAIAPLLNSLSSRNHTTHLVSVAWHFQQTITIRETFKLPPPSSSEPPVTETSPDVPTVPVSSTPVPTTVPLPVPIPPVVNTTVATSTTEASTTPTAPPSTTQETTTQVCNNTRVSQK